MSTERAIAEKFKEAMETRNIDVIVPYLAEGMTYDLLPSTVGRKLTMAEWIGQATGILTAVQSFKLDLTNVIEHPLFIVVQANVTLVFSSGPFAQEVIWLFHYTKDANGSLKVASIVEYVDSFKVRELKVKMGAALHLQVSSDS